MLGLGMQILEIRFTKLGLGMQIPKIGIRHADSTAAQGNFVSRHADS